MTLVVVCSASERHLLRLVAASGSKDVSISDRGIEVHGLLTHEWGNVLSCEIELLAESKVRTVLRGAWNWFQNWHNLALEIGESRACYLYVVAKTPSETKRHYCGRLAGDEREHDVARARADLQALVGAWTE